MKIILNKLSSEIRKEFLKEYSTLVDEKRSSFLEVQELKMNLKTYFKCKKIIKNIESGRDATFITKYKYWYKDRFELMKGVFVPQYDTEGILDFFTNDEEEGLEIGIGTGVISISLSKYFNKNMKGIDINRKAVDLSAKNAATHSQLIEFFFQDIFKYKPSKKYDFIVSNPPYIDQNDSVDSWVKENQPANALYADEEGLKFYKFLINNSKHFLKENGRMIFEIGYNQKSALEQFLKQKEVEYNFKKDLSGNWRFMEVIF